ncbi:glycosyl hydrolase family 95 catalytic domain-containing protein [Flavicella sediminum]|uniref:glycosyl hydrolase family 95 catalytic domain-containing protein n=1 Tax=Flavicella sediminum TaxID=2585141 RepID=UPI001123EACB|nr:hypothetical protein [Flavicella sediminum]
MNPFRISKTPLSYLFFIFFYGHIVQAQQVDYNVDFEHFLSKHDMVWDEIPTTWETAAYTGNGNVGFLFYKTKGQGDNVMSIHLGRHDYSDHREASKTDQMLWIKRSRLPLGYFNLTSKGTVTGVNLKLDLWNAELTGTVKTSLGSYNIKGFSHSGEDVVYFETDAKNEDVKITWHPRKPVPPVYSVLKKGGGPKAGGSWARMRAEVLEMPEEPTLSKKDGYEFCFQPLYKHRGETTTGWKISGKSNGKQELMTSVHHSYPERNSLEKVTQNLDKGFELLQQKQFVKTHQKWWHEYYPLSFVTFNDPEKESFYWIQMYKFGSATRGNGPIMDLMGPWYHDTFWPMVWGDLNVELQYWTHLTANRLEVGQSLPNNIDKYTKHLEGNVPERWKESAAIAALFPQNMDAYNGAKVPDMLVWILNDYWLHCEFAGDHERMRDNLFPILKKAVNSYLNYIKDNPVESTDGKIHIKNSWSPEYPSGHGQDVNFTLALIRWGCQTLVDIDTEFNLQDPLKKEWQNLLDNLVDFQVDKNGLRIGKDIAFEKPHRHYSHLLAFYPLSIITPETKEDKKLLKTSLDHWLDVTFNSDIKVKAMPVTGYTATGAASMYACLGDADKAYYYLDFLIKHKNISPTTMYAEGGNPVIESPLSFATSVHDMLLQSWGGKIRIFPATPKKWEDATFHNFRTQGAFLVSAKKIKGITEFVAVKSLKGKKCFIQTDIENPKFYINNKKIKLQINRNGFYQIPLKENETAIITCKKLEKTDLSINELPVKDSDTNLFGYSKKTKRLPSHNFYSK